MSARRSPGRRRGRAEARPKNENLKKISHELRQHVLQLLDKKPVVERQVDRLTSKNDHLCKELVVIAKLSEQLENELLLNTTDKELEEAKTQIRHQQNNIKKLEHSVKTLKSVILQTENEIRQGRSPSRLDTFIKTLEEDRDYYKSKTENLLRVFRSTSSSPKRSSTLGSMSKKKSHIQAQEEFTQLHQEVIKCTRTPRSTVVAQAMLSHVETERDTALSDLRRMAMECDSLREQLKISQETAFNEKAHLQQRIEELETTIQNLDSERLEQMSRMTLMKEHVDSLETEVKILARRSQDTENELSHQKDEYISLSLMKEKTEQILSEAQQSLTKKKYEIQLNEEKIRLLDEKIDDFSKQCFAQEEKICALKDTILQLDKEKETLQECVEEGREKIVTLEESLKIKEKTISELKILIFDMERTIQKSAEALCFCEKDITSLRQQLQETNKELAQANNNREILAQEKDRLQEHLSNAKQENQVLHVKITNYQNELDEMRQKAQDSNTEIARLKGVLNFKERENSELLENYHKACEQGESWEAKCHQVEADCNSVRLALISVESDNRRLKEKMKTLETEMEQLQSECASSHSEIEMLRIQLGNERASLKNLESLLASNREREFQSQIAEQEKDSEIQLLKEQLSLAENKLAVKSRDFTQLKNTTAQLESELGITRRQLATERFERERAVQELRCQNRTVTYQLSSTLRTLSPERTFHPLPHWSLDSSLEGNSSFKDF
ncbi:testis-specific gene 10 protein isoform X3 [Coturnix japonica]|uniref:testis-specific gene 10 protein isoform X3 n=1 Tax=Coturnix japonica TaxID=93934 RepID=UPI0007781634|nr:testis-specific gene 10 protein isoform X3 [Coturnix japonica]